MTSLSFSLNTTGKGTSRANLAGLPLPRQIFVSDSKYTT